MVGSAVGQGEGAGPTPPSRPSAAASGGAAAAVAGATPVREDLVSTAASFLRNPRVSSASDHDRRVFLAKKGLTDAEIAAAFVAAGLPVPAPDAAPASASPLAAPAAAAPAFAPSFPMQQRQPVRLAHHAFCRRRTKTR